MKIDNIDINKTLDQAKIQLEKENISPSFKALLNVLFLVIALLMQRLGLNSSNSSQPPSSDPYTKKNLKKESTKKASGQLGHVGARLEPVENPDG